jgi:hypothetical protein
VCDLLVGWLLAALLVATMFKQKDVASRESKIYKDINSILPQVHMHGMRMQLLMYLDASYYW